MEHQTTNQKDTAKPELFLPKGDEKDYVQKELDQIQSIINRMGSNSFQCKGWAMGIVTISLAITRDTFLLSGAQGYILLLPVLVFWYLDGFFLYTEQCYRDLYNNVVRKRFYKTPDSPSADWSHLFDFNYTRMEDTRVKLKSFWLAHVPVTLQNRWWRFWYGLTNREKKPAAVKTILTAMWSKTLLPFYLLPALLVFFAVLKSGATTPKEPAKTLPVSVQLDTATLVPILQLLKNNTPATAPADTTQPTKKGQ